MRNFMVAYNAVHDSDIKEILKDNRDELSEMDLSMITDAEIEEICEEVLEELFEEGYDDIQAEIIFEDLIFEATVTYGHDTANARTAKTDRLKRGLKKAMGKVREKAAQGAVKAYGAYRDAKALGKMKVRKGMQTAKNVSAQTNRKASIMKDKAKSGIKSMVRKAAERVASGASKVAKRMSEEKMKKTLDPVGKEDGDINNDGKKDDTDKYLMNRRKAIGKSMKSMKESWADAYKSVYVKEAKKDDSYLETNMKKRQANNEKARKDMEKMGTKMKNPHFEETQMEGIRDVDPEKGTKERKARLEKKRGMKMDDHPQYKKEKVDEMIDPKGAARIDAAKKKKKVDVFAYDRKLQAQGKLKGKKLPPPPTNEEVEQVEELYKGKHGQTEKQYADSRSQGGKMVSGDSKMSGAEYTHGRRVKAANPGMQPDVGGKTKPKSQGKMDKGTRAELMYRKANLKKEGVQFSENELEAIQSKVNSWED